MRTHVRIHTRAHIDAKYTHAAYREVAAKWFALSSLLLNCVVGGAPVLICRYPLS